MSHGRKSAALVALCFAGGTYAAFMRAAAVMHRDLLLSYEPDLLEVDFQDELERSQNQVQNLQALASVASYLLLLPLANAVGRRPVMLVTTVVAFFTYIWIAASQSLNSHLVAVTFQAFFSSVASCLPIVMLAEMTFVHQRNTFIGAFVIATSAVADGLKLLMTTFEFGNGWRSKVQMFLVPCAVTVLMLWAYVPETKFPRSFSDTVGETHNGFEPVFPNGDAPTAPERRKAFMAYPFEGRVIWKTFKRIPVLVVLPVTLWAVVVCLAYGILEIIYRLHITTASRSWKFHSTNSHKNHLMVTYIIASLVVFGVTCLGGDYLRHRLRHIRQQRQPDVQLLNLILPTLAVVVGTAVYVSLESSDEVQNADAVLAAFGTTLFGIVSVRVIIATYALESYPMWTSPVVALLGIIGATDNNFTGLSGEDKDDSEYAWLFENLGKTFGISLGVAVGASALAIVLGVWGPRIRAVGLRWTAKTPIFRSGGNA